MKFEYKFVRLDVGWLVREPAGYREEVHQRAREGWRLVQVFAPGIGAYGTAKYFELIFEREVADGIEGQDELDDASDRR